MSDEALNDESAPLDEGHMTGRKATGFKSRIRAASRSAASSSDDEEVVDDDASTSDDGFGDDSSSSPSSSSSSDGSDWDDDDKDHVTLKCSVQQGSQAAECVAYASLPRSGVRNVRELRGRLVRALRRQLTQRGFRGVQSLLLPWLTDADWSKQLSADSVVPCLLRLPAVEDGQVAASADAFAQLLRRHSYQQLKNSAHADDGHSAASTRRQHVSAALDYLRTQPHLDADSLVDGLDGYSVFTLACTASYPPVVEALLAMGADALLADASGQNGVQAAAKAGRADVLGVLLTALHHVDTVELLAPVERGVYRNWLPLHLAICSGELACVALLLELPLPQHYKPIDRLARNVLHLCALYGSAAMARLLLERTPVQLHSELLRAADSRGATPLMLAALQRKHELCALYLAACPGCVNVQDSQGDTALHHAYGVQTQRLTNYREPIGPDHFPAAYLLIVHGGADVTIANQDGDLAFDLLPPATAALFEAVAANRHALLGLHWSDLLNARHPFYAAASPLANSVRALVADHLQDVDVIARQLAARGGCPVFSEQTGPSRRRKPVPDRNPFLDQLLEELDHLPSANASAASDSSSSSPSVAPAASACPFGFTGDSPHTSAATEKPSACPFGFTGASPHTSAATEKPSACPFGFTGASPHTSADKPSDPGISADLFAGLVGGAVTALLAVGVVAALRR